VLRLIPVSTLQQHGCASMDENLGREDRTNSFILSTYEAFVTDQILARESQRETQLSLITHDINTTPDGPRTNESGRLSSPTRSNFLVICLYIPLRILIICVRRIAPFLFDSPMSTPQTCD